LFAAATAAAVLTVLSAAAALAGTPLPVPHPRREQVNSRLLRQHLRIRREVREGELRPAKAARLRRADWRTRVVERRMASRRGGYITRRQQLRLNRRETRISRRIGR